MYRLGKRADRFGPQSSLDFPHGSVLKCTLASLFSPPCISCFSFHPFVWGCTVAFGWCESTRKHFVPRLQDPRACVTQTPLLSSLQNANGEVTDFLSFYTLPSTIMNHPTHKSLKAAYSFYNVHTQTPLLDLMSDALVLAKMVRSRPEGWRPVGQEQRSGGERSSGEAAAHGLVASSPPCPPALPREGPSRFQPAT